MLEILSSSAVTHFEGEMLPLKRCEQRVFLIFVLQTEESEMEQPPANGKEICMERRINCLLLQMQVFSPNCYSHDFFFVQTAPRSRLNICLSGRDDKTLGREDSFSSHDVFLSVFFPVSNIHCICWHMNSNKEKWSECLVAE